LFGIISGLIAVIFLGIINGCLLLPVVPPERVRYGYLVVNVRLGRS